MRLKRLLALVLSLMLLCGCTAHAADYSSTIESIYNSYKSGNRSADTVYQQIANGTYRTFEMTYVIANILDTRGTYSSTIESIYNSYKSGNRSADTVYQQVANGTYRTFEMFYVIAQIYNNRI